MPADHSLTMAERHVALRCGERVLVRPLKAEDAALYPDFLKDVTREDLRLRFFSAMRELAPEMIDRLVHYDAAHAMAFIAIDEETCRMLGVVRLHDDPDDGTGKSGSAEFAILVRSELKGHGLGWLLMKHMIAYAHEKGLHTVHGQVLAENVTMLQMCAELGFHAADDPDERGVKAVTLTFEDAPALTS
jgi:RimJ/RimL family protein N-acetyltransferase